MAVITDGFGPSIVPAGSAARRARSLPSSQAERAGRTQSSEQAAGPREASRFGNPARWAEAAATRQLDRTLGRLTALDPNASTAEAEQAVTSLTQVGEGLQARRAGLAAGAAVPSAGRAEGRRLALGSALGDGDVGGISRQAGDLLGPIG